MTKSSQFGFFTLGLPPQTPRLARRLAPLGSYAVLALLLILFAPPAQAITLDEMMRATNRQPTAPAAKPQATTPAQPAAKPAAAAASAAVPSSAAIPASTNTSPTTSQKLPLVAGGSCGILGALYGGCPEGGMATPKNMPELKSLMAALPRLTQTTAGSQEQRKDLLQLANQLSKIDPQKLQTQLATLEKAPPSVQFGALRNITVPDEAMLQSDPAAPIKTLLTDATGNGSRVEGGMQQALGMLKAMRSQRDDPTFTKPLEKKIANLETLVRSRAASTAAKQVVKPFMAENGILRTHPRTGKPLTTDDIASTLMMLSLESGEDDSAPEPATTSRKSANSLDSF